jgi:sterol 3beta-glucosyltransferase
MIITILTTGTRGDTQPYIALGLELKKAGHQVRIAAFENFENFVKSFGLDYCRIHGDVSRVTAGKAGTNAMKADNPLKLALSFKELQGLVFNLQKDFFAACLGSDVIVYHPGAAIGYFAAQQLGVPSVLATPFPMAPTGEYPSLIFYNGPRMGKRFNLLTHKLFQQVMWSTSTAPIKQFWKEKFGRAPKDLSNPFHKQRSQRYPTVTSCSNFVFPQPADWPAHVHNTGYWFLDEEPDWKASSELLEFLSNGAPPVYVGFGSMGNTSVAEHTTRLVIEALQRTGQRGLLASGWSGMSKMDKLPDGIFMVESAPHSWLFPQMAAVIHHGGAGTTAAGLRAGVPSIVITGGNDTLAWGRRVHELGVGPKPIARKNLTAANLADAIRTALTMEIREAAKELGTKVQSENGARTAAQIIISTKESR